MKLIFLVVWLSCANNQVIETIAFNHVPTETEYVCSVTPQTYVRYYRPSEGIIQEIRSGGVSTYHKTYVLLVSSSSVLMVGDGAIEDK